MKDARFKALGTRAQTKGRGLRPARLLRVKEYFQEVERGSFRDCRCMMSRGSRN